jgi:hypothetical protein
MKRIIPSSVCIFALVSSIAKAADIPVEPSGIYKDIDVRLLTDTAKALRTYKGPAQQKVIDAVIAKPEAFAPPVLYLLSSVLFDQGKKDEAMFWYYAGQLRGRIDANICADRSAATAIGALNDKFGPPINQYSFKNIPLLTNTVERVLVWEEKTPCDYDRRWINLHGMDPIISETNSALSAPQNQWEAIRKRTRDDYRTQFHEAMAEFSKRQH